MTIYSIDADSLKNAFNNKEPSLEYQSPISSIYHEMETQIKQTVEGKIFNAISDLDITIDREGLIRAIEADRKVQEGKLVEVVRCKDCKWNYENWCHHPDEIVSCKLRSDWFCPLGERKEDGEIH